MVLYQGTGNIFQSDLYAINNIVQNSMLTYPKELIIGILRNEFELDSYYHYVKDAWGFPKTPDHTDLPSEAGIFDDVTTRVYIGQAWRFDVIYYPAIIVRNAGSRYVPISINREQDNLIYDATLLVDGYGNQKYIATPTHFLFAGVWEGSISVDVMSRGIRERDDLVELVKLICTDIRFKELQRAGVLIKGVSSGAPSETDDRNDKLHRTTITLDIRSEWRRHIPVTTIVDAINICVDFGRVDKDPPVIAPNMEINIHLDLIEQINMIEG